MNQPDSAHVNTEGPPILVGGHFGEFLQGVLPGDGTVALVTCPCPLFWSRAVLDLCDVPFRGDGAGPKALRAASLVFSAFRIAPRGVLKVRGNAPPGTGVGSSTTDVLAAIRAVARCLGRTLEPTEEAALCVEAEGASDPLMFPESNALFAPRAGRILREFPKLPAMRIVGGFHGLARETMTVVRPATDLSLFLERFAHACLHDDLETIARLSTLSAMSSGRDESTLRLLDAARNYGEILGMLVAHTGSAAGLILPAGSTTAECATFLRRHGFQRISSFDPSLGVTETHHGRQPTAAEQFER